MASSSAVVSHPPTVSSNLRLVLGYGVMIAGMVVCYLAIRSYGETLSAPAAAAVLKAQAPAGHSGAIGHVLLSLVVIIILARYWEARFTIFINLRLSERSSPESCWAHRSSAGWPRRYLHTCFRPQLVRSSG